MNRRLGLLAAITAFSTALSGLAASPASAGQCGLLGLLCAPPAPPPTPPAPAPSPTPAPPPAPTPTPAPAPPGTISEVPAAGARILELVNQERAAARMGGLEPRAEIASFATRQSLAMAGRRDIWHNNGYFTASTRRALGARALGENVALNGSVEDSHRRLMASPGHRANILNPRFDAVGISVVHDEHGVFYVTENFVDSQATANSARAKGKVSRSKARKSGKAANRSGRRTVKVSRARR